MAVDGTLDLVQIKVMLAHLGILPASTSMSLASKSMQWMTHAGEVLIGCYVRCRSCEVDA